MIVISELPSAGLGNKLFAWAAGAVCAEQNNCKHIITGLTKIHLGPWLRGEMSKRFYVGYFKNEAPVPLRYLFTPKKIIKQRDCDKVNPFKGQAIFNENPHWKDLFIGIREHRDFIKRYFMDTLAPNLLAEVREIYNCDIAVHIRLGDFRELSSSEDFSEVGLVRTPLEYFVDTIVRIRKYIGQDIHVSVFSDGSDDELSKILSLPNVTRVRHNKDILDLIGLSKSKVLITSAGSSFSKWAAFMSDGVVIDHYQHYHSPIRDKSINTQVFEGTLSGDTLIESKPLLADNLKYLFHSSYC